MTSRPKAWLAALAAAASCSHAQPPPTPAAAPPRAQSAPSQKPARANGRGAWAQAQALSEETHALLREQGERLWTRWTKGTGPLPAAAIAEHARLASRESLDTVVQALEHASRPVDALALRLLHAELATLAVAREAAPQIEAVENARAAIAFAAPGDQRPERGERDLDRLLTDEANAKKRGAIAQAEARAAQPLAPLALARDEAVRAATERLGLRGWAALVEELHASTPAELAELAERTLAATEQVARRAVVLEAERNLGIPIDKLRRADLPRLARSAAADPQFPAGRAWEMARSTLAGSGVDPGSLTNLRLDLDPSPSKAARPLALLVDPPADVRLSVRPAGGFEEQRAVLHEAARAVGGSLAEAPRWELAQLGDGSAAEGVAQLFEELAGDPEWLREHTQLRGEPLDDVVHTQAARRLLAARRAAAMVLYDVKRREVENTAAANAALYRSLLQRATFAAYTDDDAGRWALEADGWLRAASQLEGALLAAHLDDALRPRGETPAVVPASAVAGGAAPQPATWWRTAASGAMLRQVWALGRSGTAAEAASLLHLAQLDPKVLAAVSSRQLAYSAPDAPPPTQRPDYKYMQGDRKKRRKQKKK